jgi:thiol reductant ABC exporter CydC subunit
VITRLWQAMAARKGELLLAAIVGALASACAVALLGTSGWLIARAAEAPPVLTLTVAAVMVRAFALGRAVLRYLERLIGHDAAFAGLARLRVALYEGLERISPVGLAGWSRGDLLTRLVGDVDTAIDLPLRVVLPWAQAMLVATGTVVFVLWLDPGAGLAIGVLALLALLAAPWLVAAISRRADRRLAPARGELAAAVLAGLQAVSDLRSNGRVAAALQSISERDARLTALNRRVAWGLGTSGALGALLQGAAVVSMLAIAIPAVTDGRLGPVWLVVVALLPIALFDILGTLPSSATALQRVRTSARRIGEIVDARPIADHGSEPMPSRAGSILLRGVSAHWPERDGALRIDEFAVPAGARIAIVGPSGAGKSTLAAVLLGFLPYQGSVLVCDTEIRDADDDAVHRTIGVLAQHEHVFDTTLEANIRIGSPHASQQRLLAAIDAARLGGFVESLPHGLQQEVGSFGMELSGGQRQRLALARLLIADHPIVILDEPTEHLDQSTARELDAILREQLAGRTTLLITHRLEAAVDADEIWVLIDGRVAEHGTHAELADGQGWYAQRWAREQADARFADMIGQLPAGAGIPWPPTASGWAGA